MAIVGLKIAYEIDVKWKRKKGVAFKNAWLLWWKSVGSVKQGYIAMALRVNGQHAIRVVFLVINNSYQIPASLTPLLTTCIVSPIGKSVYLITLKFHECIFVLAILWPSLFPVRPPPCLYLACCIPSHLVLRTLYQDGSCVQVVDTSFTAPCPCGEAILSFTIVGESSLENKVRVTLGNLSQLLLLLLSLLAQIIFGSCFSLGISFPTPFTRVYPVIPVLAKI